MCNVRVCNACVRARSHACVIACGHRAAHLGTMRESSGVGFDWHETLRAR